MFNIVVCVNSEFLGIEKSKNGWVLLLLSNQKARGRRLYIEVAPACLESGAPMMVASAFAIRRRDASRGTVAPLQHEVGASAHEVGASTYEVGPLCRALAYTPWNAPHFDCF